MDDHEAGAPNQVVTKYPQAIPQAQLKSVNSSDPRLLCRSRFLRDASANPNLRADLRAQIVEQWRPLQLQITEADSADPPTNKNFCERQGRCFLGCLPAARHTLNKSLLKNLPLTSENRVFIRPLANVDFIEPISDGYKVHYTAGEDGSEFHPTARTVIVAAGCLGSTEILLRSREKSNSKLVLSDALAR